jgi:hypothetical protein
MNATCVSQTELDSFLIEISALILAKKDDDGSFLVDKILDKTGMKGTGTALPSNVSRLRFGAGILGPSSLIFCAFPLCYPFHSNFHGCAFVLLRANLLLSLADQASPAFALDDESARHPLLVLV